MSTAQKMKYKYPETWKIFNITVTRKHKTSLRIQINQVKMTVTRKIKQKATAGKDEEKRDPLHTAHGTGNYSSHQEITMEVPQKTKQDRNHVKYFYQMT